MRVEALVAQAAIERFHERIGRRRARPAGVQGDAVLVSPAIERLRDEFLPTWDVVHPDGCTGHCTKVNFTYARRKRTADDRCYRKRSVHSWRRGAILGYHLKPPFDHSNCVNDAEEGRVHYQVGFGPRDVIMRCDGRARRKSEIFYVGARPSIRRLCSSMSLQIVSTSRKRCRATLSFCIEPWHDFVRVVGKRPRWRGAPGRSSLMPRGQRHRTSARPCER